MGGLIGGISARRNGRRQARAIREGQVINERLQREALDLQRPIFAAGNLARDQQLNALGLNGDPNQSYNDFENSGFFRSAREGFDVDRDYLDGSAAARGGLFSGAHIKALDDRARERASGAYGQYYNALAGVSGSGQTATNNAGNILRGIGSGSAAALNNAAGARSRGNQAFANALGGNGGPDDTGGFLGFVGNGILNGGF